jgi:hypothetical protein
MLTVQYSPQDDLKNWLRLQKADGAAFQITNDYPFDRNVPLSEHNIDQLLQSLPPSSLWQFQTTAKLIEYTWGQVEVKELEAIAGYLKITEVKINAKASLTTAYKMPYDHRFEWFMIQANKPLERQIENVVHELFHICQNRADPNISPQQREYNVQQYLVHRSNSV